MSVSTIYSSTPNYILNGIKDMSTKPPVQDVEMVPQHLPYFFTLAEKGNTNANILSLGGARVMYGDETFSYISKFCTHVTPFINGIGSTDGQLMMIKRLKPKDAKTAWIRFAVGFTKQKMTETYYEEVQDPARPSDPTAKIRVKKERLTDVDGYSIRWTTTSTKFDDRMLNALNEKDKARLLQSSTFGGGLRAFELYEADGSPSTLGTGISAVGSTQEMILPIFDLEVTDFGEYGNNLGLRIYAPNEMSRSRPDTRFFKETLARPFRVEMIKRKNKRSSATVVNNNNGETYVDVVFKPDTVNPFSGNTDMYIGTALLDQYRDLDTTGGRVAKYGSFNDIHVYEENVEYLVKLLYEAEKVEDNKVTELAKLNPQTGLRLLENSGSDADAHLNQPWWQMDFLTGKAINGLNYRTVEVKTLLNGGKDMVATTDHWATGGDDGLSNLGVWTEGYAKGLPKTVNDLFNELVQQELQAFGDDTNEFLDITRYPFSVFYDTGFPVEVKNDIFRLTQFRKDISVCVSTHSVDNAAKGQPGVRILNRTEETGITRALSEYARSYPESEIFGTGACRANVIMQCGTIIGSSYRGKVPMTYELAIKRARFMGQPNGEMRTGYGYDQEGLKQLEYVKHVSNPFMPYVTREKNWTNGATWAQFYDTRRMFFPAVRTVYRDETSVLVSDINMLIATDLEKVCFRTWRRLVGDTKRTPTQLQELSDRYIIEETDNRYDGRVIIKPETFFTPADKNRGYSWQCHIHMYANNMKTVGVFGIIAHRQEDLEG